MGPESAKSFPGQEVIDPAPKADRPAGRAKQAADYGRRGKGYVFGAFIPATGEALTQPYAGRTTANWIDFLERVERWIPAGVGPVYAVLDNLPAHRGTDALLFSLAHPVGVRVPADVRGVPEPDRTVVEGAPVAGAEGPAVRDVAIDRGGRGPGDGLLERSPAPVRVGQTTAAPAQAITRRGYRPGRPVTWRMHH
jgi:hypothetical protein